MTVPHQPSSDPKNTVYFFQFGSTILLQDDSPVQRFTEGDQVRVDIPDKQDPDYPQFHGRKGTVKDVMKDNASDVTGDERDEVLYKVRFEDGTTMDFRWRDLRPP